MGLKDLKKGVRTDTENRAVQMINPKAIDDEANKFISAAGDRQRYSSISKSEKKELRFIRCIFSLNEDISKEIDCLSFLPTNFRAGRSDVVKAALRALQELPKEKIIQYLQTVTKNT